VSDSRRIIFGRDLGPKKGLSWTRQHRNRKINNGSFPPPDGRVSDDPTSPPWWFEETIDGYLIERANALAAMKNEGPGPGKGSGPLLLADHQSPRGQRRREGKTSDEQTE
jgi:hypothetical protein